MAQGDKCSRWVPGGHRVTDKTDLGVVALLARCLDSPAAPGAIECDCVLCMSMEHGHPMRIRQSSLSDRQTNDLMNLRADGVYKAKTCQLKGGTGEEMEAPRSIYRDPTQ